MVDWYLEDSRRLKGQPKRTIGEYVESQGILVPKRFASLKDARESGLQVIARSEHEQDYAGCSGLVDSCRFTLEEHKTIDDERELERVMLAEPECGVSLFKQYCNFLGLDVNKTKQEVSFSFWELIPGINRMVTADSSIPGRYHVISDKRGFHNYTVIDPQSGNREYAQELTSEQRAGFLPLIELYEKIRSLGRFDSNNCPIMEFQTDENRRNYFLQYHRGRDFYPSKFVLDREPKEGELEVPFVRGATDSSGMNCKVTVYYTRQGSFQFDLEDEDGSWDKHWNYVFPELRSRQRKIQMIDAKDGDLDWEFLKLCAGHLQRSKLFKPQVSIVGDMKPYLNGQDTEEFYKISQQGHNSYMNLHIISDGRRAFVRRID